jgi:hypothetical protein
MNRVLEWVKSNMFIVIFGVLILASMIALPLIASGMNEKVASEVDRRARQLNELAQLERTSISIPGSETGETKQGLVNERLLEQYRQAVRVSQEDADLVHARALEFNQKGRTPLMGDVFPAPPRHLVEVIPRRFHERVIAAYNDLMTQIESGTPPALETLREDIERRDVQFRTHTLSKEPGDPLTDEEQRELNKVLGELRMLRYQEAAERISMYVSPDAVQRPMWNDARLPSLVEMYQWQWNYWLHQDILLALYNANRMDHNDSQSPARPVLDAPVKHVVRIALGGGVSGGASSQQDGDGGGGLSRGGGMGGGGGGQSAQVQPSAPNPRAEAPKDFSASFTGRRTNPLYDVRYVNVDVVVETAAIPLVIDAFAHRNFMTVVGLQVTPVSPYQAAANGYFYGSEPVSMLSIRVETIWFREWTKEFMPDDVKQILGVPVEESVSG